jgi:hypothetical protein
VTPSATLAELACDEAEALLPLVADGAVDADGDPALFAHLARCPRCQDNLARHDLITLAIADGHARPVPRRLRLPPPSLIAAALVLAGLAGWLAFAATRSPAAAAPAAARIPPATVPAPVGPRVYRLPGGDPARPLYVLVDEAGSVVIDPTAGDARPARDRSDAVPVKF